MEPIPAERDLPPPNAPHLELSRALAVEALAEQRRRQWLRAGAAVAVAGFTALHAAENPARYMFLGPLMAVVAWGLDVSSSRREATLVRASESVKIDGAPLWMLLSAPREAADGELREAWLSPGRAGYYLPLTVLAGAISIDSQRFPSGESTAELLWYLGLAFASLITATMVAWRWWSEGFSSHPRGPAQLSAPLSPGRDRVSQDPSARKSETTRTFGTPFMS